MIRLYFENELRVGERIRLPKEELKYLKQVRRSQGEVVIFNRLGIEASGTFDDEGFFEVEKIWKNPIPTYQLTVAVGLPEASLISDLIRALSELGASELLFFCAARSQSAAARLRAWSHERYAKIAVEAARQCARPQPLVISTGDWSDAERLKRYERRWFFDESDAKISKQQETFGEHNKSAILVIGPEGGFSEEERKRAAEHHFQFVHFKTPVLRVSTAVISAAFYAVERLVPQSLELEKNLHSDSKED